MFLRTTRIFAAIASYYLSISIESDGITLYFSDLNSTLESNTRFRRFRRRCQAPCRPSLLNLVIESKSITRHSLCSIVWTILVLYNTQGKKNTSHFNLGPIHILVQFG